MKKESKLEKRVADLEGVNDIADEKAHDDRTITLKEVYERVISLETRLDIMYKENKETTARFRGITYIILILLTVTTLLSFLTYQLIRGL